MPSAFISYSWDSQEHKQWVFELATRLRNDGIEAVLDQWHLVPGDRLPAFMEQAIRDSDYVLIICTPRYKEKADRREGGVGYEEDIITGEVLTTRYDRKFLPILRSGEATEATPTWVGGKYYIDLRGNPYSEIAYQDLKTTILRTREPAPRVIDAALRPAQGSRENNLATGSTIGFEQDSPTSTVLNGEDVSVVPPEINQFEGIQLEVHKVRRGYVQDEKEIVSFRGCKLYGGSDFRGRCEVFLKTDGKLIFYYQSYGKMIYAQYDDINEAKRAWKNGYPVHDHSAIKGAAAALGIELEPDERQI